MHSKSTFFFFLPYIFVFLLCSRLIHTFSTACWAFYNKYNTSKLEVENMAPKKKNHTAEYSIPVAYTLNSASSSTLPNFDPLSFSSVCSSFFTANLSSYCKSQQWLWLCYIPQNSPFSPCRYFTFCHPVKKRIVRWHLFSASHQQTYLPMLSFLPSKNVRVILKVNPSSWNNGAISFQLLLENSSQSPFQLSVFPSMIYSSLL